MNILPIEGSNWHSGEVRRSDEHIHSLIILLQHRLIHQRILQIGSQRDGVVHIPHLILERLCLTWSISTKRKSIRADPNGQTFIVNLIFCHQLSTINCQLNYSQLPAILLFVSSRSPIRSPYHSPSVWSSLSSISSARFLWRFFRSAFTLLTFFSFMPSM